MVKLILLKLTVFVVSLAAFLVLSAGAIEVMTGMFGRNGRGVGFGIALLVYFRLVGFAAAVSLILLEFRRGRAAFLVGAALVFWASAYIAPYARVRENAMAAAVVLVILAAVLLLSSLAQRALRLDRAA
ncbi:hypothetical protein [Stagnihabitans tardus]|uniref:Uncharacterized protein n=1 Tax=Stagnihabitans tardus TaxID=2699202 RepID=A0AAE4YBV7_9RHOB|nr:hypothetical protein [Stagnihabitans tardus]NBZ89109.1 hypothetical protein [Stagnihabitans tardus]